MFCNVYFYILVKNNNNNNNYRNTPPSLIDILCSSAFHCYTASGLEKRFHQVLPQQKIASPEPCVIHQYLLYASLSYCYPQLGSLLLFLILHLLLILISSPFPFIQNTV